MKKAPVIFLLACISVLCSCSKNPFSNGEVYQYERKAGQPFQIVEINDNLNVSLKHSDPNHPAGTIIIKIGENLIDNIGTEIEERLIENNEDTLTLNALVITNNNAFSYLRPYDYTREMTVYYDSLLKITFNSNAELMQTDTLHGYLLSTHFVQDTIEWDSLASNLLLEVEGGSGNFNVSVNCYKLTTKCIHGTSDININGKTTLAYTFADYDSHGVINSKKLDSHIHYINTNGTNVINAKTYHLLDVKNGNIGEVHYLQYWTTEEEHVWNDTLLQIDTIIKQVLCPKVIRYNSEYIDIWTYNNDIPGLVKERE